MTTQSKKLPATAFQFFAPASIDRAEGERALTGVAYSGDIVTDHGYWNRLVIDLSTLSVDTPIPLLCCHDHDETIGLVTDVFTTNQLSINARLFADVDDEAAEIAAKADKGFPWQLSVGIWPKIIEDIPPGVTVSLNGRTFTGPITIFREGRVREISVVAIGADHRTSATVLNSNLIEIPFISHEDTMDIEKLNAKIAQLEAELVQEKARNTELSAQKPDPAKFAPVEALSAMQVELAALRADKQEHELNALINPALNDGRLSAAQESWARDLGKSNLSALTDFLKTAQPLAALSGTQTGGKSPANNAQRFNFEAPNGYSVDDERASAHAQAVTYMEQHKCTYLAAVKAVGVN